MKTIIKCLVGLTGLISLLALSGCATVGKNTLPHSGNMTMAQIYKKETGLRMNQSYSSANSPGLTRARMQLGSSTGVERTTYTPSRTQINQEFRQLPNPEIPMYVYPHLVNEAGGSQPVPGYATAFFMYRSNHFAMPSENY